MSPLHGATLKPSEGYPATCICKGTTNFNTLYTYPKILLANHAPQSPQCPSSCSRARQRALQGLRPARLPQGNLTMRPHTTALTTAPPEHKPPPPREGYPSRR